MNREIMIKEAIRRMKKLGIHQPTIEQFQEDGTVTRSETKFGFHYWVEEPELEWIRTQCPGLLRHKDGIFRGRNP